MRIAIGAAPEHPATYAWFRHDLSRWVFASALVGDAQQGVGESDHSRSEGRLAAGGSRR